MNKQKSSQLRELFCCAWLSAYDPQADWPNGAFALKHFCIISRLFFFVKRTFYSIFKILYSMILLFANSILTMSPTFLPRMARPRGEC